MIKKTYFILPILLLSVGALLWVNGALASHNPAQVTWETGACGETTFMAEITDPGGTHIVDNMRLVVHADGVTQFTGVIPVDGSTVSLIMGPFSTPSETIQWRVFGGDERDYDNPLWDGYGEPGFGDAVNEYGIENGFGFVVAGPDDPNPFTNWNTFDVEGCVPLPETKDDCKKGGWMEVFRADGTPFTNQGDCIQYVNTGK